MDIHYIGFHLLKNFVLSVSLRAFAVSVEHRSVVEDGAYVKLNTTVNNREGESDGSQLHSRSPTKRTWKQQPVANARPSNMSYKLSWIYGYRL